jgi:two-component system, OmpR family, phosphate regulon sensor histidine kinase PhoR
MKKAFLKQSITLLILMIALVISVAFFAYNAFLNEVQNNFMQYLAQEVELSYNYFDGTPQQFVTLYDDESRRITLFNERFLVIADSHDNAIGINKSDRPELNELESISRRQSNTIHEDLIYYALKLDDGNYLRVSVPSQSLTFVYANFALYWLVGIVLLSSIYIYGMMRLRHFSFNILNYMKQGLKDLQLGQFESKRLQTPYADVNQIIEDLNVINIETANYVQELVDQQAKLDDILNQMPQAILVLNEHQSVTFYNSLAKDLFNIDASQKRIKAFQIVHEKKLIDAVDAILKTPQLMHVELKINQKYYQVILSPLSIHASIYDILIVFIDVTKDRMMSLVKRDFFAHTSHELKSPLTAIQGYAELIENNMVKPNEHQVLATKISEQTHHMSMLIEDMLMLSRLEHFEATKKELLNLQTVLQNTLEQLTSQIQAKAMNLKIKTSEVKFEADPLDMHKLFKNLIENAIKYSDESGIIEITLKQQENIIQFIVKDHGHGIPLEHQERVFERFYRIEKGRLDKGTGLGLAIVKHIVIKYHGDVTLKSQVEKGTTITVTFDTKKAS